MYGIVYAAYSIESKLQIGLYALVGGVLSILLIILLGLCTYYSNKVSPDVDDDADDDNIDDGEDDLSSLQDDSLSIDNNESNDGIAIEPSRSLTSIATNDDIRSAVSTAHVKSTDNKTTNVKNTDNKSNDQNKVSFFQYLFGMKKKSTSVQPDNNQRVQHINAHYNSSHHQNTPHPQLQHRANDPYDSYEQQNHKNNHHHHDQYHDQQQYYYGNQQYNDQQYYNDEYYGHHNQQYYDSPNQQYYDSPNQQYYDHPNQQYYGHPNQQYYDSPNQQYYDNHHDHAYVNTNTNTNTNASIRNTNYGRSNKRIASVPKQSKSARKPGFGPYK